MPSSNPLVGGGGPPTSYLDLRLAAFQLEMQLEANPKSMHAWSMASDAYHSLSRHNVSFLPRVIECCRAMLNLLPEHLREHPEAAQTWTNLAKVLGEAGKHDEAIDASSRAYRIRDTFYNGYQHAESLLTAKRHDAAQAAFRALVKRRDASDAANQANLAEVYNHLAVSLLETARKAPHDAASSSSSSSSSSTTLLDAALDAVSHALRLNPACKHSHAHNYYQVLASILHARNGIEFATAALWPVAAQDGGELAVNNSAAYLASGFQSLSRMQAAAGDDSASVATLEMLRSLGGSFAEACDEQQQQQQQQQPPPPPPTPASLPPSSPPPPPSSSAAIIYLCCADEAELLDLHRSLHLLYLHFNGARGYPIYPVVIFHDLLNHVQIEALVATVATAAEQSPSQSRQGEAAAVEDSLSFVFLDEGVFDFPPHMSAAQRVAVPRTVRGYGLGYRHMCRFFSGPVFEHPALSRYELLWRLDSDSYLLAPPLDDPFAEMARSNASYGWVHAYRDEPVFVTGLWETTRRFMHSRGIDEAAVHAWVPGGHKWADTPMCFATNCFLARRAFFASGAHRQYFDKLDQAGGFYAYRWGDACVHMLSVAALLPPSQVLRVRSLAYWHQGTVMLPQAQREDGTTGLLAERKLPPPTFAGAMASMTGRRQSVGGKAAAAEVDAEDADAAGEAAAGTRADDELEDLLA